MLDFVETIQESENEIEEIERKIRLLKEKKRIKELEVQLILQRKVLIDLTQEPDAEQTLDEGNTQTNFTNNQSVETNLQLQDDKGKSREVSRKRKRQNTLVEILQQRVEEKKRRTEEEAKICSICLEHVKMKKPICPSMVATKTICNHYFHYDCIYKCVVVHKRSCPMCRAKLSKNDLELIGQQDNKGKRKEAWLNNPTSLRSLRKFLYENVLNKTFYEVEIQTEETEDDDFAMRFVKKDVHGSALEISKISKLKKTKYFSRYDVKIRFERSGVQKFHAIINNNTFKLLKEKEEGIAKLNMDPEFLRCTIIREDWI
jgi:nitrate reductase alpha subunit